MSPRHPASATDAAIKKQTYLVMFRKIARVLRLGTALAEQQFVAAIPICIEEQRRMAQARGFSTCGEVDNRVVWGKLCITEFCADACPSLVLEQLRPAIRFYIGFADGTPRVERGLGRTRDILNKHCGPLDKEGRTTWVCLEVLEDGPQREDELFTRSIDGGPLEFTKYSRRCSELWMSTRGRRFLVNKVTTEQPAGN